jgi:hypothetical protein
MFGKRSHVDIRKYHVNMGSFSEHDVGKNNSHVNMQNLFLMVSVTG